MIILCLGRFSTISSISGSTASRPRSMKLCPPILMTFASGRIWITGCRSSRAISSSSVSLPITSAEVNRSKVSLSILRLLVFGRRLAGLTRRCRHAGSGERGRLCRGIPELDSTVHASGRHHLSVMRERDTVDTPEMSLQRGHLPAGGGVPEAYSVIEARRREHLPVRRERAEPDPCRVAFERRPLFSGLHVEKLHVLTGTSRRPQLAIRGKCHRVDGPGMHVDSGNLLGRGRVPQLYAAIDAARRDHSAVGRIRQRLHSTGMPGESGELLVPHDVPELDGFVIASRDRCLAV